MAELPPRSFECDGLLVGPGTPYALTLIESGGKPEAETQDTQRPREDGAFFGEDRLTGRLLSLELTVDTTSYTAVQAAWAELATVWDTERVRKMPGSVVMLRIRQFDGDTRVVFGRPGRCTPVEEDLMNLGRLDVVLDFRCIDHRFYSDVEQTNTVGIIPSDTGGLSAPLTDPLTTFARSEVTGEIIVEGDTPAYLASMIRGPITQPTVDVTGQWQATLRTDIADGSNIFMDPQPWSRAVRRDGVANVSGKLSQTSPYLSEMVVPPGRHEVVLRGTDATGTANVTTTFRHAYLTL